ncbi:MAG: glycosyltransferase family 2 protein [Acidobacteriaceae bacterium]|nr:glycosyltransferase family 2 protein [Acidobacteriaceae bacterium]
MATSQVELKATDTPLQGRCAVSVVVTSYYEERSLREFHSRLKAALESMEVGYEIVMVNDGSTDGTWPLILTIMREDPNVVAALDMARNAGQGPAMTAGLNETSGERVVFIDSDLQLAPEDLPKLISVFDKGYDMVTGYRQDRQDSLSRKLPSLLANVIMRRLSRSKLRDFGCTFKVFNGDILRAFGYGPHKMFHNAEVIAKLSRYTEVPVSHAARRYGKSGWTFAKLYRLNMDNIVSMSDRPFQIVAAACFLAALLFIIRVAIASFTPFHLLPEITHGLLLNAILIGFLIDTALICAVGEFAIRSFSSSRRLPIYVVRERWRRQNGVPTRVLPLASQTNL